MQNRWNDDDAQAFVERYAAHGEAMALRVYTSRLIGADDALVLHGGGNTSLKGVARDVFGDEVPAVFVKGSGWDLAAIEPAGLPESVVYDVVVDPTETTPITAAPSCSASDALAKLPEALRGVVEASSKQGASGGDVKIDQAEKCKLCALGYLSGPDCDGC